MGILLLTCALLLGMPKPGVAAISNTMYQTADSFSDIGDAMRAAESARNQFDQHRSGPDAARYEREWRDSENKLEDVRIKRMATEAKMPPNEIRRMREEGHDWKVISDRYRIDSRKMGYGHKDQHGYDRDHDNDLYRHLHQKGYPNDSRGHYPGASNVPPARYKNDPRHEMERGGQQHYDQHAHEQQHHEQLRRDQQRHGQPHHEQGHRGQHGRQEQN